MERLLEHLLIALTAALAGSGLASHLRQPAILGFLAVGLFLSPFTPGVTAPIASIDALAEIGVIFLLFAVGVQLSLPELVRAGRIAILGGSLQVVLTLGLGVGAGLVMGWSPVEALVFGAVLSNSSSTVLSRVLLERGELESRHGKLAIAWSSVQDMSTIVLVAMFSALSPAAAGGEAWRELAKGAVFLLGVTPAALWLLPRLFERVALSRSRELFTLAVATVALGMAWTASLLGVSLALGAFVAGVVVGESPKAHRILGEAIPLRDIFSGVFFVSIGMSIDPAFVVAHWQLIAATAALTVLGKGLITTGVALLLRCPRRVAVLLGAGLAQSAEFSFLLAQVARELDLIGQELFGTLLGGAALSILVAPAVPALALALLERLRSRPAAVETDEPADDRVRGHTIVCGHGRVGATVTRLLERLEVPVVVVDEEPDIVRSLVQRGTPVVEGDATQPPVLERAGLARARVLVACVPERMVVRRLVEHALARNPELVVLVRTHRESEMRHLYELGASAAVMGELTLAIELGRGTAQALGLDPDLVRAALEELRRGPTDQRGQERRPPA
ncbi:cation:proton antiporter [Nannocystis pusilla]|uniref:Cation:proton antiporter n=1 Tax=Nannocystis pusilla TaxID=889268 RepID=A0ABS7U551_9BACT|nr:cation:proton antiporter [Nannocystis pusilla]MBZ5715693.1 cation:proton antiporter [Nannocystis pusilla]